MKIKKIEHKPMTIHRKKEMSVHRKRHLRTNRNIPRRIDMSHGPSVKKIVLSKDFISNYKTRLKYQDISHKTGRDREVLHRGKRNNRVQLLKNDAKFEKQTSLGSHSSFGIRTLGMVGVKNTLNQLEGGEELRDSAAIASVILRPMGGTIEKGRDLHRSQSQKKSLQMKIKQVNVDSLVVKREINIARKKVIPQNSFKVTKESMKVGLGIKRANTDKGVVASITDSTRVTVKRVSEKTTGSVVRRTTKYQPRKANLRNNTKNRMLQYFLNKTNQNQSQNQDSAGKVLKDLLLMKASVVTRHIVSYIGGLLLSLVLLISITCIPVILIIAVVYNSPFAIFFPPLEEGDTVMNVTSAYVHEFNQEVSNLANTHPGFDGGIITSDGSGGNTDNYYDIIVVYMVKYGVGDMATVMNDTAKSRLREVFDDMCNYTTSVITNTTEDEDGTTVTYTTLSVDVKWKSYREMISIYGFDEDKIEVLGEMMSPENLAILQ